MTDPVTPPYYVPSDVKAIVTSLPAAFPPELAERIKEIFETWAYQIKGLRTGYELRLHDVEATPPDAPPEWTPSALLPYLLYPTEYVLYEIQEREHRAVGMALREWFLTTINGKTFDELGKAGIEVLWVELAPDGNTVQDAWIGMNLCFDVTGIVKAGDLANTPDKRLLKIKLSQLDGQPISAQHDLTWAQERYNERYNPALPGPAPEPGEVVNSL